MANSECTIRPFPAQGRAAQIPKRVALYEQKRFLYALQSRLFDGTLNWADRNPAAAAKLAGCFMLENGDTSQSCH